MAQPGKRELHRREMMDKILAEADKQMVSGGAASLSLREISRALGIASSAIYRYVASRDELLTILVVRAFSSLADAVDSDTPTTGTPEAQFRAIGWSMRTWALAHPEQYALLYGTPVPGFAATPTDTVVPGTRVLYRIAELAARSTPEIEASSVFVEFAAGMPIALSAAQVSAVCHSWAMLLGAISSEVFGYFGPGFERASEEIFEHMLGRASRVLGL